MRDRETIPEVVDRAAWQAEIDPLRKREGAHVEGDAIAAARRRLPMVEVDGTTTLIGPHGPVTLLDTFEGRRQLVAYYHSVFETYWTGGRDFEVMAPADGLADMTVYGRQEAWEDLPQSWPRRWVSGANPFRTDGRPTAQWSRMNDGGG
jgi:predicted dithiol-disulfide oxidoreductase (DUF899 family)